jgi:hypothetical protein
VAFAASQHRHDIALHFKILKKKPEKKFDNIGTL